MSIFPCCKETEVQDPFAGRNIGPVKKERTACQKHYFKLAVAFGIVALIALVALAVLLSTPFLPVAVAGAIGSAVLALGGTTKVVLALTGITAFSLVALAIFGKLAKPQKPVDRSLLL